ncbi:hypothetical protein Hanom_Chr16g01419431 [Helianthus anomalus]
MFESPSSLRDSFVVTPVVSTVTSTCIFSVVVSTVASTCIFSLVLLTTLGVSASIGCSPIGRFCKSVFVSSYLDEKSC